MHGRVTNYDMSSRYLGDLQSISSKLAEAQRTTTTGKRIDAPSDDPFGTSQVLGFSAQLSDIASFQENVSDALSFLGVQDGALTGVVSSVDRVRQLLLQAANSPTDQGGLNAIAQEVAQLREAIRDNANSRYGDTYVFSGTATSTQPYPPVAGNQYDGNAVAMQRRVSPGLQVPINQAGTSIFGAPSAAGDPIGSMDLFDLLDQAVSDLQAGTPAARANLGTSILSRLDQHLDNIAQQHSNLGSTMSRLEVTKERLADLELRFTEAKSNIEDADMPKAYMEFQSRSTMYQAALSAGSRIMQTSLVDFL